MYSSIACFKNYCAPCCLQVEFVWASRELQTGLVITTEVREMLHSAMSEIAATLETVPKPETAFMLVAV